MRSENSLFGGCIVSLLASALLAACSGGGSGSGSTGGISLGAASGEAGSQVTVPISMEMEADDVVTVAPLLFDYDDSVLDFESCESRIDGKLLQALAPSPGRVGLALYGNLDVIPDGTIAACTFTIADQAASGSTALKFVRAGLADLDLQDIEGAGSDGSVTVQ
jgi:hypothetical protein